MNLKSELVEVVTPLEQYYPCLMRSRDGSVVLFSSPKVGMLLVPGRCHFTGHWRADWIMDQFTLMPVGTKVTLEVAP